MARFGFDYESLSAGRDDLLMVSMPLYGQTGPWANYMGYGHVLQAVSGFNHLTGWKTALRLAPGSPTPISRAALRSRRRDRRVGLPAPDGKGSVHRLQPARSRCPRARHGDPDWTAIRHEQIRLGNHDMEAAPTTPTAAAMVAGWPSPVQQKSTGRASRPLSAAPSGATWTHAPPLATPQRTEGNRPAPRLLVRGLHQGGSNLWKKNSRLRKAGRPTGAQVHYEAGGGTVPVFRRPLRHRPISRRDARRPQLAHRHHYWKLEHPYMGLRTYDAPAFRLSETPGEPGQRPPRCSAKTTSTSTRTSSAFQTTSSSSSWRAE